LTDKKTTAAGTADSDTFITPTFPDALYATGFGSGSAAGDMVTAALTMDYDYLTGTDKSIGFLSPECKGNNVKE